VSRFSGPQERSPVHARGSSTGALARYRSWLREEAAERSKVTRPERKRTFRDGPPGERPRR
jgi:hypothetical protein